MNPTLIILLALGLPADVNQRGLALAPPIAQADFGALTESSPVAPEQPEGLIVPNLQSSWEQSLSREAEVERYLGGPALPRSTDASRRHAAGGDARSTAAPDDLHSPPVAEGERSAAFDGLIAWLDAVRGPIARPSAFFLAVGGAILLLAVIAAVVRRARHRHDAPSAALLLGLHPAAPADEKKSRADRRAA